MPLSSVPYGRMEEVNRMVALGEQIFVLQSTSGLFN